MTLSALVQAIATATTTATAPFLDNRLLDAAALIVIGLNAWMIRVTTETRATVAKIQQSLFGEQGDNGIKSSVIDHERRLVECEGYITRTVPERLESWKKWKDGVDEIIDRLRPLIERRLRVRREEDEE